MRALALGVDLGGTNARAAVVDRDSGEIVSSHKAPHRDRSPATVVESVAPDRPSPAEIARRVALRMRRQTVLDSLRLRALLDASILQRETGGPAVMARQLDHLGAMAARPNIEVRILPLDERAHAAGRGSFMLFSHSDDDLPFMAVIDTAAGPEYLGKEHELTAHIELWAYLWRIGDELA